MSSASDLSINIAMNQIALDVAENGDPAARAALFTLLQSNLQEQTQTALASIEAAMAASARSQELLNTAINARTAAILAQARVVKLEAQIRSSLTNAAASAAAAAAVPFEHEPPRDNESDHEDSSPIHSDHED